MQGHRQQEVTNYFGVNMSTTERLVRRLRETGRFAYRPRSGRPRLTFRHQASVFCLSHLHNRHLTAIQTALTTASLSPRSSRNREKDTARGWYLGTLVGISEYLML